MRNKLAKITLAAGFMLALAFTFGCGDDKDNSGGGGGGSNGNSFSYQGKTYKTVKIGSQIWMAENLNYNINGSKCYDDSEANCDKYGRLYSWTMAMSVCPSGWHLPSNDDWDELYRYVDSTDDDSSPYESPTAGRYLKSTSGWDSDGNGEDKYGFSALPGGFGSSNGSFYDIGSYGFWWSSTSINTNNAYSRSMYYDEEYANWFDDVKSYLFSVRCLRN